MWGQGSKRVLCLHGFYIQLNALPMGVLGNWCLKSWHVTWELQPKARRYPWQPHDQEPPQQAAAIWHHHTEPDQWKSTHLAPHTYRKKIWNFWREGRAGDLIRCTLANWSTTISLNPQRLAKTGANWSTTISLNPMGFTKAAANSWLGVID